MRVPLYVFSGIVDQSVPIEPVVDIPERNEDIVAQPAEEICMHQSGRNDKKSNGKETKPRFPAVRN